MDQRRERRTGRRRGAGDADAEAVDRIAQPVHRLPIYELASEEALDLIHSSSLALLSDVGIDFYHDEAQAVPLTAVQADAFINKLRASMAGRQWRAELVPHAPTPTDPKNTTGA